MAILAVMFAQGIGGSAPILMMVAIFAIFYVLLIMPQQRKQKKWAGDAAGNQARRPRGHQRRPYRRSSCRSRTTLSSSGFRRTTLRLEVARSSIVTLTTAEDQSKSEGLQSLMNKNLLVKTVLIVAVLIFFLFGIFGIPGSFTANGLTDGGAEAHPPGP